MRLKKEARQDCNHGRATHKGNQILSRDQIDVALAVLIGCAIMFGALLAEAIGL